MQSWMKWTTLAIGFSTSISSFAGIGPGNLYVGVAGGLNEARGMMENQTTAKLVFGGFTQTNVVLTPNPNVQYHGVIGTLLAGYNISFTPVFALALEGRLNYLNSREVTRASVNETVGSFRVAMADTIRQKNDFNVLIKPGINLNDNSQVYVVAGLASSLFQSANMNLFSLIPDPSFSLRGEINQYFNKRKAGGLFGVGFQQTIAKNFNIRLEFDYVDYGKVLSWQMSDMPIVSNPPSPEIAGSTLSSTVTSSIKNTRASLAVVYNFG